MSCSQPTAGFAAFLALVACAAVAAADLGGDSRPTDLPPEARGFAGTLLGVVVAKGDGEFILSVREVTRSWPHSKAADAGKLVGREVRVGAPAGGENAKPALRYIESLLAEEKVEVDVTAPDAAAEGGVSPEVLTLTALSDEQRKRARID